MAEGHSSTAARQSKVGLRNTHARQRRGLCPWFQCGRAHGHLGNKGCGSAVGKLVMARKGSERSKDFEVEAHLRAECRCSQSADVTKARATTRVETCHGLVKAREHIDEATAPWAKMEHDEQGKRAWLGDRLGRAVMNRVRAHANT